MFCNSPSLNIYMLILHAWTNVHLSSALTWTPFHHPLLFFLVFLSSSYNLMPCFGFRSIAFLFNSSFFFLEISLFRTSFIKFVLKMSWIILKLLYTIVGCLPGFHPLHLVVPMLQLLSYFSSFFPDCSGILHYH